MASKMYNRARMTVTSTGTGSLSLGVAVAGYQTFSSSGAQNGDTVSYTIEDGVNWEVGTGTFNSVAGTLSRTVTQSFNGTTYGTSAISVTTNAQVYITALAADIVVSGGDLGTPSAGVLTNATQLPLTTGVTGKLGASNGGTDQNSYTIGDILYASGTTALSKLADVATGNALISGGVGTAPSWGKVGLTTHVSGTLPVANGGTNASSAGITAFNNITGYTASGATGTTSTNLVFSTSPSITTPTFVTSATGPLFIGGTGTTSTLILRSTSGAGTAGADIIFQTGNNGATEGMRLLNNGNFGIGTTSPSYKLDVVSTADAYARLWSNSTTATSVYFLVNGNGTTASRYSYFRFWNNDSTGQQWRLGTYGDNNLSFVTGTDGTSFSTTAILDTSGNYLIGTTSTAANSGEGIKLKPADGGSNLPRLAIVTSGSNGSNIPLSIYSTGAAAYRFYVTDGGTINATNTTITSLSDRRLKENIVDLDVGLDALLALKPRKFDWKAGKGKDIKGDRGWIADEFQQVFPDLIDTWKDEPQEGEEPYKSVRPDLMPVVVNAIQELAAKVSALEARV